MPVRPRFDCAPVVPPQTAPVPLFAPAPRHHLAIKITASRRARPRHPPQSYVRVGGRSRPLDRGHKLDPAVEPPRRAPGHRHRSTDRIRLDVDLQMQVRAGDFHTPQHRPPRAVFAPGHNPRLLADLKKTGKSLRRLPPLRGITAGCVYGRRPIGGGEQRVGARACSNESRPWPRSANYWELPSGTSVARCYSTDMPAWARPGCTRRRSMKPGAAD